MSAPRLGRLAVLALLAGLGSAGAQQPPQPPPPPRNDNPATLRAIPDGPGKRVAELQGLDKVTARTQRFYAPVGQADALRHARHQCRRLPGEHARRAAGIGGLSHHRRPQARPARAEAVCRLDVRLDAGAVGARRRRLRRARARLHDGARDPRRPARAESRAVRSTASASFARNSSRGTSIAPKLRRCSVMNWQSSRRKPPLISRAMRWTSATLRGIALAAEHALAEEGRADRHAIEPADQLALAPAFDAVRVAAREQLAVERQDRLVDPALGMAGPRLGAGPHHRR